MTEVCDGVDVTCPPDQQFPGCVYSTSTYPANYAEEPSGYSSPSGEGYYSGPAASAPGY